MDIVEYTLSVNIRKERKHAKNKVEKSSWFFGYWLDFS